VNIPARAAAALALLILCVVAGGLATAQPPSGTSLEGQLLVATPDMPDPRFARTVIFMVKHDATGAHGFVVNRPVGDVPLRALMTQMGLKDQGAAGMVRIHTGGPVGTLTVFALHTADWSNASTMAIKGGFAVTTEPAILEAIASGSGPRRVVILVGYAGWAPGQLEAEMKAGAWVRATADEPLLFDPEPQGKWDRAMARRKIDL
jgi:putative transcriptional regulator